MTNEEAIEYWEQFNAEIDDLYDACSDADRDVLVKQREIVEYTISALRQQEHDRNEPLTMDELRQMPIRDWVWIEILNPDAFRSKETVSAYYRKYDGYKADEIFWCGYPGLGFGFDYSDYGKTWLAYRQKPEEWTV